ncbi:unnamed protein product [Caenorhabditis bovis]|uniref:C2 domain-containing protein n=1 Tax=Caenorhabditis bovis TaxID=2654633 RepID=A0A8S1F857_9PELO|nr:unnamed protein product [Caenorhabditis bovis]
MPTESVEERRRQVLLGELPSHFLRLAVPIQSGERVEQLERRQLGFFPPNTRGRLSITIQDANLVKNYSIVRMDPYCRIRVGNVIFETNVASSGGRNPSWNRTLHAWLPHNVESVYVQIFDEKTFGPDEVIAWSHIILPTTIFNGDVVADYFPLSGPQGENKEGMIHLTFAFAAIEQQQQQQEQMDVPPPRPVEITDEDTKELEAMFPSVDKEVIKCVLEERRGDKDATVNALLEMTNTEAKSRTKYLVFDSIIMSICLGMFIAIESLRMEHFWGRRQKTSTILELCAQKAKWNGIEDEKMSHLMDLGVCFGKQFHTMSGIPPTRRHFRILRHIRFYEFCQPTAKIFVAIRIKIHWDHGVLFRFVPKPCFKQCKIASTSFACLDKNVFHHIGENGVIDVSDLLDVPQLIATFPNVHLMFESRVLLDENVERKLRKTCISSGNVSNYFGPWIAVLDEEAKKFIKNVGRRKLILTCVPLPEWIDQLQIESSHQSNIRDVLSEDELTVGGCSFWRSCFSSCQDDARQCWSANESSYYGTKSSSKNMQECISWTSATSDIFQAVSAGGISENGTNIYHLYHFLLFDNDESFMAKSRLFLNTENRCMLLRSNNRSRMDEEFDISDVSNYTSFEEYREAYESLFLSGPGCFVREKNILQYVPCYLPCLNNYVPSVNLTKEYCLDDGKYKVCRLVN